MVFEIGLPAKSGVSGLIFVVIPGVCGICVFSPPLDEMGNSVKGVEFFKRLVNKFNIHIFDTLVSGLEKKKSLTNINKNTKINKIYMFCKNGEHQQLGEILEESDSDLDLNEGDYDNRRPLHIAVEEEKIECVKILINKGARHNVKDRWGNTPLEKAKEINNMNIVNLFENKFNNGSCV